MASLTSVRAALAESLRAITGLNASPYLMSNPTPPAAEIQPSEVEYDQAFNRGMDAWTLVVRVFVASTLDQAAQDRMDAMLASSGANSVKAALEADTTLGGACDDLQVTRCSGYRIYSREGMPSVLGAEWTIRVLAAG